MRFLTWECKLANKKGQGWCLKLKKNFKDFFWKIYEPKMKNPWKTCHRFFRVDRVYIHQNDRLDLTVNEFFTVWKTMFLSQRYFQFFEFFHFTFLRISLATKHRFPNREKLVNREIETVVLMYINPINSKKSVTSFSWIFHFWLIDFSKKIFEIKKKFQAPALVFLVNKFTLPIKKSHHRSHKTLLQSWSDHNKATVI